MDGEDIARANTEGAGRVPDWQEYRQSRSAYLVIACLYAATVIAGIAAASKLGWL